jgi:hypothetical protein
LYKKKKNIKFRKKHKEDKNSKKKQKKLSRLAKENYNKNQNQYLHQLKGLEEI